jgi:glyoxylase-like metal-dependent hydrolase (beta-lactamase superfamily II)
MCTRCAFVGGLLALGAAAARPAAAASARAAAARPGDPQALEAALPGMRRIDETVWLDRLSPNVWLHTTTSPVDGLGYYPANGAIVVDGNEALLIDTGWNAAQTAAILDAWGRLPQPAVARAVVTHFHNDRLGGIDELSKRGIPAFGNPLTIGLARDNGFTAPEPLHDVEKQPQQLGSIEVRYPGPGHTLDNVVVWVPSDGVLFGGCLVKSTTANDLGNLGDANVAAWPASIRAVLRAYAPRHVVPGHGTIAGDAIAHTIGLADAANRERS